jgi:hypothetical protein
MFLIFISPILPPYNRQPLTVIYIALLLRIGKIAGLNLGLVIGCPARGSSWFSCTPPDKSDGVIGIFHWHNPSGRPMALGSAQPLREMSTRNISCGSKGGRCVGLTKLPLSCADCLQFWEPQPSGTLRACPGLYRDCFTFIQTNVTAPQIKPRPHRATSLPIHYCLAILLLETIWPWETDSVIK